MNFIKKTLLALSLAGVMGLSTSAGAVTISHTYDPADVYLQNYGGSHNFSHNIASVMNGFVVGVDTLVSATLDLFFRDDKAKDGDETYRVQIGLSQVFSDNDLEDQQGAWEWIIWPIWGQYEQLPGSVTETVTLSSSSLSDLALDGIINLSVKSTAGDFYFEKSILNAEVTRGSAVPEPATLGLLGLGLLGFAASRRKSAKNQQA